MRNIISHTTSLLEALGMLNELPGSAMTLFVTDADARLLGSLTDGDIRRALLGGATLHSPVADACHRNFKAVRGADIDVEMLRDCRRRGITMVPRIDSDGRITEIIDLNHTRNRLPLSAILMAGGIGERLRPLTLTTPKPLLQIEGKAIIDYNIEALADSGITHITAATRYLAEQLDQHFSRPVAGVQVSTVREESPLGTIGAAALVDIPSEGNTLVMNSDLITTISFEDLYLHHVAAGADATIAVVPYQVSVPYAILSLDGDRVTGLEEKPSYSYYANAGIYIFANRHLRSLPTDRRTDATDLIEKIIAEGGKVSYFPIKGTWIDVGSHTDFRQAAELMRHHNNLTENEKN